MLLHYLVKVKKRKCNIPAGYYLRNLHQLHQSGPGTSCALHLLICGGVIQQYVYKAIIHDINDLQKRLMQTFLTLTATLLMLE